MGYELPLLVSYISLVATRPFSNLSLGLKIKQAVSATVPSESAIGSSSESVLSSSSKFIIGGSSESAIGSSRESVSSSRSESVR